MVCHNLGYLRELVRSAPRPRGWPVTQVESRYREPLERAVRERGWPVTQVEKG